MGERSYFLTTMLCMFTNLIDRFILLHFNCASEVSAVGTGNTGIVGNFFPQIGLNMHRYCKRQTSKTLIYRKP